MGSICGPLAPGNEPHHRLRQHRVLLRREKNVPHESPRPLDADVEAQVCSAQPVPSFRVALVASLGLLHPQTFSLEGVPFKGGRSWAYIGSQPVASRPMAAASATKLPGPLAKFLHDWRSIGGLDGDSIYRLAIRSRDRPGACASMSPGITRMRTLPPYSYVPGHEHPDPVTDPRGHLYRHTQRDRTLPGDFGAARIGDAGVYTAALGLAPESVSSVIRELEHYRPECWHTSKTPVVRVLSADLRLAG